MGSTDEEQRASTATAPRVHPDMWLASGLLSGASPDSGANDALFGPSPDRLLAERLDDRRRGYYWSLPLAASHTGWINTAKERRPPVALRRLSCQGSEALAVGGVSKAAYDARKSRSSNPQRRFLFLCS